MSYSNIQALLKQHSKQLEESLDIDGVSARIEIQCLLQKVLQVDRSYLLAHPELSLDEIQQSRYSALLERRLSGEPVAYLLGSREFYGLNFKVSKATLIPRPETELLVDLSLQRIPRYGEFRVLDLGTGSGAIALSIANARPNIEMVAVDASQNALDVALENKSRFALSNVRLMRSNWFSALIDERFDLIVANPPYIATGDEHLSHGDLRFEPLSALASGPDGLNDIRAIISQAMEHINPKGYMLFEHGYDQAENVCKLLKQAGFDEVFSARDLSGNKRASGGISK